MDESALDAFEARAEAAEKRLAVLEAALLSPGAAPAANSVDLSKQQGVLEDVRKMLLQAKSEQDELQAKYDKVLEANKKLEVDNSKLHYQIKHLKRAVQEAEG